MRGTFTARLLVLCLSTVEPHGILTTPEPRANIVAPGIKLQGFENARSVANRGCGGPENQDPGVQIPKLAYIPGTGIEVEWQLTIPHDADNRDTGIRIALHYGPEDSFDCNILRGGLEGDAGFGSTDDIIRNNFAVGPPGAAANTIVRTVVTLPPGKTCDYCVLQWVWAARSDNGYYVSCADIAITDTGLIKTPQEYLQLPSEAGNELPIAQPRGPPPDPAACVSASANAGATGSVVVLGMLLAVAGVAAAGFSYYKKNKAAPRNTMVANPAYSNATGGGLAPGWREQMDPASGRPYYVSDQGQTSWEKPVGGPAPPMPPPGPPGGLPPGWTSSIDPASGRTYYVNSATGATSWEMPTMGYA